MAAGYVRQQRRGRERSRKRGQRSPAPSPPPGWQPPPAGPPSQGRPSPAFPALHGRPRPGLPAADPRPTHPRRSGAAAGRPAPPAARSRAAPAPAAAPCLPCGSAGPPAAPAVRPPREGGEPRTACASLGPRRGRRKPPRPARTSRGQKPPQAATLLSEGGSGCPLEPAVPGVTFRRCHPRVALRSSQEPSLAAGGAEVGAPADAGRPEGRLCSTPHTSLEHLLEGRLLMA